MKKELVLKISGMHCKGCALGLTAALEKLPQVERATVRYPEGDATLLVDDASMDAAAIEAAVRGAGFQVTEGL